VPAPLTVLDRRSGEGSHRWPQGLPGGHAVLFTCGIDGAPFDDASIDVVSLATGERRRLVENGAYGRYAGGRLFFVRGGRLLAVAFDSAALTVHGTPTVVAPGVRYDPRNGGSHYAVADGGTLVYRPAAPRPYDRHVAWVDAAGRLARITDKPRPFREPRLGPAGQRVALRIGDERASDLWILDTKTGSLTRSSFGLAPHRPIWTPDGRRVTVSAEVGGRWQLLTLTPGGTGAATVVWEGPYRLYPNAWTPDARSLVFQERRPATGWDLRVVEVGPDGGARAEPRDLAATAFQEENAAVSPDGRHVAYESDELDSIFGIYVKSFAAPGARVRATEINARWPRWASHGQLFCWYPAHARAGPSAAAEGIHRIRWREGGRAESADEPLWTDAATARSLLARVAVAGYATYDVDLSSRDPRFLVLENAPTEPAPLADPIIVLNAFREPARR
jgi:hypothetical protein